MTAEGGSALLEAGTWLLLWKVLKHDPFGSKGKKGVVVVSEAMMDLPSGVWPVVTTRGGGRGMMFQMRGQRARYAFGFLLCGCKS